MIPKKSLKYVIILIVLILSISVYGCKGIFSSNIQEEELAEEQNFPEDSLSKIDSNLKLKAFETAHVYVEQRNPDATFESDYSEDKVVVESAILFRVVVDFFLEGRQHSWEMLLEYNQDNDSFIVLEAPEMEGKIAQEPSPEEQLQEHPEEIPEESQGEPPPEEHPQEDSTKEEPQTEKPKQEEPQTESNEPKSQIISAVVPIVHNESGAIMDVTSSYMVDSFDFVYVGHYYSWVSKLFMSFNITRFSGANIDSAVFKLPKPNQVSGDLSVFDSFLISSVLWGPRPLKGNDFTLIGIPIQEFNPQINNGFTCEPIKLREEIQKAIDNGQDRFQIMLEFTGFKWDGSAETNIDVGLQYSVFGKDTLSIEYTMK